MVHSAICSTDFKAYLLASSASLEDLIECLTPTIAGVTLEKLGGRSFMYTPTQKPPMHGGCSRPNPIRSLLNRHGEAKAPLLLP
jgi:hypothetical protein